MSRSEGGFRASALTIPEQVLVLLSASQRRLWDPPTPKSSSPHDRTLAQGRLIELVLARRVAVESRGRSVLAHDVICVTDPEPTGDSLLDEVLERIDAAKEHGCSYWVDHLDRKGTEIGYWERLVDKSLLEAGHKDKRVAAPDSVAAIKQRIAAVLADPQTADLRGIALVTLLARSEGLFNAIHGQDASVRQVLFRPKSDKRDQRTAENAVDLFSAATESAVGLDDDQRRWAITAAHGIDLIARTPRSGN